MSVSTENQTDEVQSNDEDDELKEYRPVDLNSLLNTPYFNSENAPGGGSNVRFVIKYAHGDIHTESYGSDDAEKIYGDETTINLIWALGGDDFVSLEAAQKGGIANGNDGDDLIHGSSFSDQLTGGLGNDVIRGNAGADRMGGGSGRDTFEFRTGDGQDVIGDFDPGYDTIKLLIDRETKEEAAWSRKNPYWIEYSPKDSTDENPFIYLYYTASGSNQFDEADRIKLYSHGNMPLTKENFKIGKQVQITIKHDADDFDEGVNTGSRVMRGTKFDDIMTGDDGKNDILGNSGNDRNGDELLISSYEITTEMILENPDEYLDW